MLKILKKIVCVSYFVIGVDYILFLNAYGTNTSALVFQVECLYPKCLQLVILDGRACLLYDKCIW